MIRVVCSKCGAWVRLKRKVPPLGNLPFYFDCPPCRARVRALIWLPETPTVESTP